VSWYQPVPADSLEIIRLLQVPLQSKIIDIGGGDSLLADHLLDQGYSDVTVLDISETALVRARKRLGPRAGLVKWIAADAESFRPQAMYDLWHDRAAFHFLTDEPAITNYFDNVRRSLRPGGRLVLGAFSEKGPEKCSGLAVQRYSESSMARRLEKHFEKVKCLSADHRTPAGALQHFVFCGFRRRPAA
jgi:ubiquinone/menaquinone biosynthesis C-methylase UbiE